MEKEVQFKSKGVTLRGVLNMPEGPEPHLLLVMAGGCEVLGLAGLSSDARFRTNADRAQNQSTLQPLLEHAFVTRDRAELLRRLAEAGVPGGPINSIPEALAEPQVRYRDMVQTYDHQAAGSVQLVMSPFRFGAVGTNSDRPPPALGQHTDEILTEFGIDAQERAYLRESGVV